MCWISDYSGEENLSGVLSHPIPKGINGKYVGPLSRFRPHPALSYEKRVPDKKYDLLITLSGPEPQRTKLEEIILKQLKDLPSIKAFIIQGLPGSKPKESGLKNIEIVPHLGDMEFLEKLNSSEVVLSRPGYSTIMDLDTIDWKKAIFIPTPGQTEHEYLGKLMQEKGMAVTYNQKGFSLKDALEKAKKLNPITQQYNKENFRKVVDEWLETINP